MAENRNLHVTLSVDANTKAAQDEFQRLQNTLRQISQNSISINTSEMQAASKAAQELSNHLQTAFNVKTGQLDLGKFNLSLNNSKKNLNTYIQTLKSIGPQGEQAFVQLASAISQADAPLIKANTKLNEFLGTLKNTARWQISSSILHGFMGAIQTAYGYAQDLNSSLNNIQIVTNHNADYMANFAKEANKAAQALNTTTTRYTEASLIFYQQGLSDEEVKKRTNVVVKMANASRQSAEEVSQQLTSVWNNFYDGAQSLEYYADVMTALGAATASSSSEIAEGLQKFASIGETVGLSYEYAASALATITATTRESADTVGNALKTLFARIQGLKLGDTLEDGVDLNKYSAALEAVGVHVLDANGSLRDMDNILEDLGSKWQNISREQQTALAQTVAGQRQYAQFMTLMNNWDFMQQNLNTSYDAKGTLQQQADIYAQSWEAARDRVRAAMEGIYDSLINDQLFINLDNLLVPLLNGIESVIDGFGGMTGTIAFVASFFMSELVEKIPNGLSFITQSISQFSGKAKQEAAEARAAIMAELSASTKGETSEATVQEISNISTLMEMKDDLASKENQLSAAQKETYNSLMQVVQAEGERATVLAESVDYYADLASTSKEVMLEDINTIPGLEDSTIQSLTRAVEEIEELTVKLGSAQNTITTVDTFLKSLGTSGIKNFEELKNRVNVFLDELEKTGQVNIESQDWQDLRKRINENQGDAEQLKNTLASIGSSDFKGLIGDSGTAGQSIDELQQKINALKDQLIAAGVKRSYIEEWIGNETDHAKIVARLEDLRKRINDNVDAGKNMQAEFNFSKVFGKGISTVMNFSNQLNGLTNMFTTLGSSSASLGSKIGSLASVFMSTSMMARNLIGVFEGVGGAVGAMAGPIGLAVTAAFTGINLLISKHEADLKKAKEEAEKHIEDLQKDADKLKDQIAKDKTEQADSQELLDNFETLLKEWETTGQNKKALAEAALAVAEAYDIENGAIDVAIGQYHKLSEAAKQANSDELARIAREAKQATTLSKDVLDTSMEIESFSEGQKKYTSYNELFYSSDEKYTSTAIEQMFSWLEAYTMDAENLNSHFQDQVSNILQQYIDYSGSWTEETQKEWADLAYSTIEDIAEETTNQLKLSYDPSGWTSNKSLSDGNDELIQKAIADSELGDIIGLVNNGGETGFVINIDAEGGEGLVEAYDALSTLKDTFIEMGDEAADFRQTNPLFSLITDWLSNHEEMVQGYKDTVKTAIEAETNWKESLTNITSADEYEAFIEKVARGLEEQGYSYDFAKEHVRQYYKELGKYQEFETQLPKEDGSKNTTYVPQSPEKIAEWKEKYADAFVFYSSMEFDENATDEEVEAELARVQEQIDHEQLTLKVEEQIVAAENNKYKAGMTKNELLAWKEKSGFDWDNPVGTLEDGKEVVLDWMAFVSETEEERQRMISQYTQDLYTLDSQILQKDLEEAKEAKAAKEDIFKENSNNLYQMALGDNWKTFANPAEEVEKILTEKRSRIEELLTKPLKTREENNELVGLQTEVAVLEKAAEEVNKASAEYEEASTKLTDLSNQTIQDEALAAQQLQSTIQNFSKNKFTAFQEVSDDDIKGLEALGIDIDSYVTELDNGKKIIVGKVEELNEDVQNALLEQKSSGSNNTWAVQWQDIITTFDQLEQYKDAIIADGGQNLYDSLFGHVQDTDTSWVNDVKSVTDLIGVIRDGKVDSFAEGWEKVKNNISEINIDEFISSIARLETPEEQIKWINENLSKLNVTGEENEDLWERLSKKFSDLGIDFDQIREKINLTDKSLEEIEQLLQEGKITGDNYTSKIKELLSNGDMTTAEAIDAINIGIENGAIEAKKADSFLDLILNNTTTTSEERLAALFEWLKKIGDVGDTTSKAINEILNNEDLTVQEKIRKIKAGYDDENGQHQEYDDIDKLKVYTEALKSQSLTLQERSQFLQEANEIFLQLKQSEENLSNNEIAEHVKLTAEQMKELGMNVEDIISNIVFLFSNENGEINPDNIGNIILLIQQYFKDFEGNVSQNFENLSAFLKEFGIDLEGMGYTVEDFGESIEANFEVNHFESFEKNIEKINKAFAKTQNLDQYIESMKELIETSTDLGLSSDKAKDLALAMTATILKQNGALEKNLSIFTKEIKTINDLYKILDILQDQELDEEKLQRVKQQSLIELGSQYETCAREVNAYRSAIASNSEEQTKAAEKELELATRCAQAADAYGYNYTQIKTLADSYAEYVQSMVNNSEWMEEEEKATYDVAEVAELLAERYIRVNDSIADLQKGCEDYTDLLDRMNESWESSGGSVDALTDYLIDDAETYDKLSEAVAGALNMTNDEALSMQFLAENAELIKGVIDGDTESLIALQNAAADEIITKIAVDDAEFLEKMNMDKETAIDMIQNLPVGVINLDDNQFLQALVELMEQAGYTADQIKDRFAAMGLDIEFEDDVTDAVDNMGELIDAAGQTVDNINSIAAQEDISGQTAPDISQTGENMETLVPEAENVQTNVVTRFVKGFNNVLTKAAEFGSNLVQTFRESADKSVDAGAVEGELQTINETDTDTHENVGWTMTPTYKNYWMEIPKYQYSHWDNGWAITGGVDRIPMQYSDMTVTPDKKAETVTSKTTAKGLKLKSATKTAGGISSKNISGGNKPSSGGGGGGGRRGGGGSSRPKSDTVNPPIINPPAPEDHDDERHDTETHDDVSHDEETHTKESHTNEEHVKETHDQETHTAEGHNQEVHDQKTHDAEIHDIYNAATMYETVYDYIKQNPKKILADIYEDQNEVYTNRKTFYNERYDKDQKVDEKEYQTKDSSLFLRLSEEIERYHDINNELEKISNRLDEINQRKSRAFGKAHIDAINEEKNALEQQLQAQNRYLSEMADRRKELQRIMKEQGWEFDEDGSIANYVSKKTKDIQTYNKGAEQYIEQANRNAQQWNRAAHEVTNNYNAMNRDAVDVFNANMQELTSETNNAYESLDAMTNAAYATATAAANNQEQSLVDTYNSNNYAYTQDYNDAVTNAVAEKNAAIEENVAKREKSLTANEKQRDKALTLAEKDRDKTLTSLEQQRDKDLTKNEQKRDRELTKNEQKRDKDLTKNEQERDKALTSAEKQRDKDLTANENKRDKDLTANEKDRDKRLTALEKQRDKDLTANEKQRDKDLTANEKQRDKDLTANEKERERKYKEAKKKYDDAVRGLAGTYTDSEKAKAAKEKIDKAKAEYDNTVKIIDKEFSNAKAKIENDFKNKKADIEDQFKDEKARIENEFKIETKAVETDFKNEKARIENEFKNEKAEIEKTYDNAKKQAENDFKNNKSQIENDFKNEETRIENEFSLEKSNIESTYKNGVKLAENDFNNITSKIENDFKNEKSKIENDYKNQEKLIDKTFDTTRKAAENALKQQQQENEAMLEAGRQQLKHEYNVANQQIANSHEKGLRLINEGYDQSSHEISEIYQDMKDFATDYYDTAMDQVDKQYEAAQKVNEIAKETYQYAYDESERLREEYEGLEDTMAQAMLDARELRNKIYDNALEVIDYTLNLKIELSNNVMVALTALLDSLGDTADRATDRIANLGQQMYQFTYQTRANRDAIYDLLNSQKEVDSGMMNRFMNGNFTEDDLSKLFNLDEFTADKVANLEAYRDNLISLISQQRALKEQMFEIVSGAFSEYQTSLGKQIDKIVNLTQVTQTYQNIINIVGKKVLDASGELSEVLSKSAFKTQRDQTHTYRSILDEIDSNLADMRQKQAAFDTDSEMFKDFQNRIDEMEAERRTAQENWLASWEAEMQTAADYYANAIDTITMHFEQSVAGLIGSLELLTKEYDRQKEIQDVYVDDYEKIYQLSKLTRDVQNAIDDSDHIKNKQKLKKLQEEINAANEDGVKMSQYDLDVLRKKFELELARDELEEARNAKSQVRMMRDAEGNYGYVYTADANDVAAAEQSYEDKLHELQVLNSEYIEQLESNYIQLQQNVIDEINSLDITQFATEEEYLAEVNRIQSAAIEMQERLSQQMENAIGNNRDLYENEWTQYSLMTGYKISADEDYLDKFNETTYSVLTGFTAMNEAKAQFTSSLSEAILGAIEAYKTTSEMQQIAMADGGTSMEDFSKDAIKSTEEITKETKALATEAETLSQTYQDAFGQIADSAANFAENYIKNIQPVIDSNLQLLDTIAQIIEYQANLGGFAGNESGSGGQDSGVASTGKTWDAFATGADAFGAKSKIGDYLPWVAAVIKYSDYTTDSGGWGTGETRKRRLTEVFGEGAVEDFTKFWNEYAATGELGNYWNSAMAESGWENYSYEIMKKMKFDTGGYTGNWNSLDGRLALLHEKELVLNQQDTSNILSAVDMVRNIVQMIDLNALNASSLMSNLLSASTINTANNEVLQQEVHITAEFPNATDRDEIIAAFDNLTNLAMQYAGKQNYV